jgi:hypothetical protein
MSFIPVYKINLYGAMSDYVTHCAESGRQIGIGTGFSSTLVSPAKLHSTSRSIFIINVTRRLVR